MSVKIEVTTTINGAVVENDVTIREAGESRDETLAILGERHALASGGYDRVGGVHVVTAITACDEHPDLIGTSRVWDS